MKNIVNLIFSLSFIFIFFSCSHRVKILDASAVSMTHYSIEPTEMLVDAGEVEGQFCRSISDIGQIGFLDKAILDAQKKVGADWLINASFWTDSKDCIFVSGSGKKVAPKKTNQK